MFALESIVPPGPLPHCLLRISTSRTRDGEIGRTEQESSVSMIVPPMDSQHLTTVRISNRAVVVQDLPNRGTLIGRVGTLNGYVVGDAEVEKSVAADSAASGLSHTQIPADGSAVRMEGE